MISCFLQLWQEKCKWSGFHHVACYARHHATHEQRSMDSVENM